MLEMDVRFESKTGFRIVTNVHPFSAAWMTTMKIRFLTLHNRCSFA
jgi:hypothetical protein